MQWQMTGLGRDDSWTSTFYEVATTREVDVAVESKSKAWTRVYVDAVGKRAGLGGVVRAKVRWLARSRLIQAGGEREKIFGKFRAPGETRQVKRKNFKTGVELGARVGCR